MSKKASPTLIGLFTLVGLILAAVAVVMFGAGKYFEKSHKILLFFDKSANGLQVGSDVRFGGVRIGTVDSIHVLIDPDGNRKIIPVVVSLGDKELHMVQRSDGSGMDFSTKEGVAKAVKEGLRAGMKQQSLVTGQLYIEFDIIPDTPGFVYNTKRERRLPVVPTVGTQIDELIAGIADGLKKFNSLDLEGVMGDLHEVLAQARDQISALDLKEINDNVTAITGDVRKFTDDQKLSSAVENLDNALQQIDQLVARANEGFDPLMEDLNELIANANAGLEKIDEATKELSEMSNPRAPVVMRLQNVLQETERATRSLKELSNDLKRSPNAILSGKEHDE
ncbi:MCE family protein [Luteolibacter pohnpeiensis]|uniref:MCE family protein n=1 Tax=Luteolibacter pohnpeiensis TaxID=454153 RepID=A0A934S8W7_9BACT|nr:MlaD family protein [Luteolibacter pohnpeiensis]MBK1884312.1 MCE family protein [Luteolibacter pohnpeiensis]